jgi:hypothetical protein
MNEGTRNEAPQESARGPFPWQRGWSIFKTIWPQLIYISMTAIAIPQYFVYWTSARRAAKVAHDISSDMPISFFPLLERVESFSLTGLLELVVAALLALWGYMAWVTAAFTHIDGESVDTVSVMKKSLGLLMPKGLLTFFIYGLLLIGLVVLTAAGPGFGIISQLLLITLCVVAAGAPVLLVMDPRSILRVVSGSIRMEYTRGSGMSRWSAYFVLLTYEMLLLGSLSLVQTGINTLNHLDHTFNLPRNLLFVANDIFPFGIVPMLTEGLATVLSALLFALFAIMTTSFVADLKRIGRIRATIDIRI